MKEGLLILICYSVLSWVTAAADLNDKLAGNDSLRQSEPFYENYYNTNQSIATGQLSNVRMALRSMNSAEPEIRKQIAANDTLVHYLMQSITVIDSILYTSLSYNDSISKEAERSAQLIQVSGLVQANNQLLAQLQTSRNNIASAASNVNSSINAVTDIEINEKMWNEIYFDKIIIRDFNYTTSQITTLNYLANQCPFVGGRVVYKARTALRMIGDTTVYDDIGVCTAIGILRKAKDKTQIVLQNLIVTPNPTNSMTTFYYQLTDDDDDDAIEIVNPVGEIVEHIEIAKNSIQTRHPVSNLKNGIYTCRMLCNGEITRTCKLAIVK